MFNVENDFKVVIFSLERGAEELLAYTLCGEEKDIETNCVRCGQEFVRGMRYVFGRLGTVVVKCGSTLDPHDSELRDFVEKQIRKKIIHDLCPYCDELERAMQRLASMPKDPLRI